MTPGTRAALVFLGAWLAWFVAGLTLGWSPLSASWVALPAGLLAAFAYAAVFETGGRK